MLASELAVAQSNLKTFAELKYVDMPRARRILGASWGSLDYMCSQGYLILVDFRQGGRKRVHYGSIVEHCDRLRVKFAIPDRRPKLESALLRHRDEDLLPFPLADTIAAADAHEPLGYSTRMGVLKFCEEGRFECYRLHPAAPWRISRRSLAEYLRALLRGRAAASAGQTMAATIGVCND